MGVNIIVRTIIIFTITWEWPWPLVHGSDTKDYDSLDKYLYEYALKSTRDAPTGILQNVPLPENLSGVQLSFVRLRTGSLLKRGANHTSYFSFPSGTLPLPYTKRLDIVYQNLGNLSSSYFHVPHHTLVTPVTAFLVYDSTVVSKDKRPLELVSLWNFPIIARFPMFSARETGHRNTTNNNNDAKCVRFGRNGSLELSDMDVGNWCRVRKQGHFAIVVPSGNHKKKANWIVGLGVGLVLVGLGLIVVGGVLGYRWWVKRRRMNSMSEFNVALDTIWVGRNRMANPGGMSRPYPSIQNRFVFSF